MPRPRPRTGPLVRSRGLAHRAGFTLLEIAVVVVLMAVLTALSAPALLPPRAPEDPVQRLLDTARRTAVRRAESMSLSVGADGSWVLRGSEPAAGGDLSGRLPTRPDGILRVRVSPLGACWPEAVPGPGRSLAVDPLRCRLTGASGT